MLAATPLPPGRSDLPADQRAGTPPLAEILAICSALTIGTTAVAMAALRLTLPGKALPNPLPPQHQSAENLIFLFAFLVALPLGLYLGNRFGRSVMAGPGALALRGAALLCAGSLAVCLIAVKLVDDVAAGNTLYVQLALFPVWVLSTCIGLGRLGRAAGASPVLRRLGDGAAPGLIGGALVAGAVVCLADFDSISLLPLGVGLLLVVVVDRLSRSSARIHPRVGLALDLVAGIALFLAVVNLRFFSDNTLLNTILQFHQDFFAGPAERVLAGHPLLDGTVSQYGVGSIYAVAGWFEIAPVNNYSIGLFEGILSAGMFVATLAALRLAGVARAIAWPTLLVALVAGVFALIYPLGGLLQHGAIRFGLPAGVLLGAVIEERPGGHRAGRAIQLVTLAIASIWALEAFAYTLFTALAVGATQTMLQASGDRRRWGLRRLTQVVATFVFAQVLFTAVYLISTGDLPDWGGYLTTLRAFLSGEVGDLTYDFEPFSPAFGVGAAYLVSIAALVLVLSRRARDELPTPVKLVAVTATSAWGLALFSYFVNRSAGHILPYICLPAFATGALWMSIVLEAQPDHRSPVRRSAIAGALALGVLVFSVGFGEAGPGFSRSALALSAPGGGSLPNALDRVWHPPPIQPGTEAGVDLLDRYMPGEKESLILGSADPGLEIIFRSGHANVLPFGDPWEDSFVPQLHEKAVEEAVAGLHPGDRALIDKDGLEAFRKFQRHPERNPLDRPIVQRSLVLVSLSSLQQLAVKLIGDRFDLKTLAREENYSVVELVPRR